MKKHTKPASLLFRSKKDDELVYDEIIEEEILDGYTIASALNFKTLGLSVAISQSGKERFGPVKDLLPLGDMVDNYSFSCKLQFFISVLSNILIKTIFCVLRMDHWICTPMILMEIALGSIFPQNLARISLFLQR